MSGASEKSTSSGIGLGTIIFLIFLILKLTNVGMVATWSWWWVSSPIWIPVAIVLVVAAFALTVWGISYIVNSVISFINHLN